MITLVTLARDVIAAEAHLTHALVNEPSETDLHTINVAFLDAIEVLRQRMSDVTGIDRTTLSKIGILL